ncbi:MAG: hypothetical protein EOR72_20455 [Mesorhizobium sp.]|uniref:type II secretion system protein GspM n=1 Tax=Mesorhizobium sp. TaxID=1871066 RepID=UPI000FE8E543|nr:type II secretion system protein GspM [Mesorhizobium sp.]RWM12890.1 MAG: hypothetical protein EOR72_20455 [Mesorhizobium sp.]
MLNRLLNAPAGMQKGIAVSLLAVAGGVMIWIVADVAEYLAAQRTMLTETRERAGALAAFARVDLSGTGPVAASGDASAGLFMSAPSVVLARANLQERINAIASANNAQVASAGNLPDLEEEGSNFIGLRVAFSAKYDDVSRTLLAIETGTPPLIVKELNVRSTGAALPNQPPELSVELRVYGAVRVSKPEADAEQPQ